MRLFSPLAIVIPFTMLHAQGRERTFNTDSGTVVIHYFTDIRGRNEYGFTGVPRRMHHRSAHRPTLS